MKYIKQLTKAQEKMMPKWAEKWIKIGLKTGKTDWKTFEINIKKAYKKANLEFPKNPIIHVQSPLVGALASSLADNIINNGKGESFSAIGSAIDSAIDSAIRSAIRSAIGSAVGSAIGSAIDSAVRSAIDSAIDSAKLQWHYWFGGQFWVGYGYYGWYGPSSVSFLTKVCKLKLSKDIQERADIYQKLLQSVNYFWTNKHFVMVCARPTKINRDEQGRLHSLTEKSIIYPDGWGLYHIHGVKFTEEQFEKQKTASVAEILSWEDIDQRSVLLRERPVDELLKNVDKKLIDHSDDCGGYDLFEIELKDIGKARFLSYKSWSSDKMYAKFVPIKSENCLETVASLRHQTVAELLESSKS